MTRILIAALLVLITGQALAADVRESTDSFGPFGTLHIYTTAAQPKHMTLFVSGDGGWNLGVIDMARSLAQQDSMVVGIDITHYIRQLDTGHEKCAYPAAHFEELSQYLQKKYRFPHYTLPVLAGYSSGATLVYTTLAQSPPNTFAGGISLGFCPDLKSAKPMCKGSGTLTGRPDKKLGYIYDPAPALAARLYVLQGDADQVCSTPDTKAFLSKINGAEMIELAKVGHGFAVQKNWMPQFEQAFQKIVGAQPAHAAPAHAVDALSDLPLVELPATGSSATLAVMVSGDGGWAGIDKQIAEALNRDGIGVIGLNSLQYFWQKKDPDIAGRDLTRILNHYGSAWGAEKLILVGYSSGADTLPFMVSRLPPELRSRVKIVALLGLGQEANFEFHVSDWLFDAKGAYQVIPEVQKLNGLKVLCIYGEDEHDSACKLLGSKDATAIEMKGGHHFSGDYDKLANTILDHSR
ncbi:MAG TPA: AcvB/VirJ family lysyl-phosphatidylglycerol hydrolase [Gallionella sp.]|nr:AcvB/VirJ family lysyl-phosphatidylglycerol hydrolase [Gallionella sp.]